MTTRAEAVARRDWWRPPPGAVEWMRAVIEHAIEDEEQTRARRSEQTRELFAPHNYADVRKRIACAALAAAELEDGTPEAERLNVRLRALEK